MMIEGANADALKIVYNYPCKNDQCTYVASNIEDMRTHQTETGHKGEYQNIQFRKCEFCNSVFSSLSSLTMHKAAKHFSEAFKCDLCSSVFISSSSLANHKEEKHRPKVHKCELCNYCFPSTSSLKMHKKDEHGPSSKVHKCKLCNCFFPSTSALTKHKKEKHKPLEESLSVEIKVEEDLFKIDCDTETTGNIK